MNRWPRTSGIIQDCMIYLAVRNNKNKNCMFIIPGCSWWGQSLIREFFSESSSHSLNADALFSSCLYSPVDGTSGGCSPSSFFCLIQTFSPQFFSSYLDVCRLWRLQTLPKTASTLYFGFHWPTEADFPTGIRNTVVTTQHFLWRKSQSTQCLFQIYPFIKASWFK